MSTITPTQETPEFKALLLQIALHGLTYDFEQLEQIVDILRDILLDQGDERTANWLTFRNKQNMCFSVSPPPSQNGPIKVSLSWSYDSEMNAWIIDLPNQPQLLVGWELRYMDKQAG